MIKYHRCKRMPDDVEIRYLEYPDDKDILFSGWQLTTPDPETYHVFPVRRAVTVDKCKYCKKILSLSKRVKDAKEAFDLDFTTREGLK